jgi:hypothetical protein
LSSHSNWTGRTRTAAAPGRAASRRNALTRTSARVVLAARREAADGGAVIATVLRALQVLWFFGTWWQGGCAAVFVRCVPRARKCGGRDGIALRMPFSRGHLVARF